MFQISISPEEIGRLELASFPGEIHVIDSLGEEFGKAVRYLKSQKVIGFDTETRPTFSPDQHSNGTALLQLSGAEKAFLFRIKLMGGIPRRLCAILANPTIVKVGAAIHDDVHGLQKFAYLYGFDERQKEYYKGIDDLWRKLRADFPDIPVMTTAMMYRDMAKNPTNPPPYTLTTDWYCPLTSVYKPELSAELRKQGKQVWWYTCCGPTHPYANMASLEYPWIEGRILGWMTHLYRADGFLFWHVNYWHGNPCLDESDTFFPTWHTYSGLHMPGDGIFLYPGTEHVLPSIRLAQVRDGVEDYEWLQLAAAKAGAAKADAESRKLIESMTKFTRDPVALRAARTRLANLIEESSR